MLPVDGIPVIAHILSDFNKNTATLLILNYKDGNMNEIQNILMTTGFLDFEVVEIDSTNGQLTSVVKGVKAYRFHDYGGPLWIYNGDTIRKRELLYFLFADIDCEGFIEVFQELGEHWSFVGSLGRISRITEKERIFYYCCSGLHGFKSLKRVVDYVDSDSVIKLKNELYVYGVYQNFLDDNIYIWAFESERKDFLLCGTPEDYRLVIK